MASQAPATPAGIASPVAAPGGVLDPNDPQYAAKMAAQIAAGGGFGGVVVDPNDPMYAAKQAAAAANDLAAGRKVAPLLFWGSSPAPRVGGKNSRDRRHGVTTTTSIRESQALLDIYKWSPAKVQKEIAKLRAYGFDVKGNDLQALEPWWAKMVTASEQFTAANRNVSPFDAPALMGSKAAGAALAVTAGTQAKHDAAYSQTTTSSSVDAINPGDAQSILNKSLSDHLGRAATPEEIQDFLSRANALAKADPKVTTKTTDYSAVDPVTGMRTSNDRNVNSTGGFGTAGDLAAEAGKSANTPEAGAYQAAAFYAPLLFDALKSPV